MRRVLDFFNSMLFILGLVGNFAIADNQTSDVSPILPNSELPFQIHIETLKDRCGNDFLLPVGLQSFDVGVHDGKWLLINGRSNGLHGFGPNPNNFPPDEQNRVVYVVDPDAKTVRSRSLLDPRSGLTRDQVDSLSVTAAQSYQDGETLYITGGYGFRSSVSNYVTYPILSAIDIPGLMHWATHPECPQLTAASHIRQIVNPIFQITGGYMDKADKNAPTLLIFGHRFEGAYEFGPVFQLYSEQVRTFKIIDDGKHLCVKVGPSKPLLRDPNYRRRDLNVVPMINQNNKGKISYDFVALSGVFTETDGIWTVPVTIDQLGNPFMLNSSSFYAFKQGMNNYASATFGMYSKKTGDNYTVILGGISYGFFVDGVFETNSDFPFINQATTVKRDCEGLFTQYIMNGEYPVILSTQSNPGNPLLFGASAIFIPANGLEKLQYDFEIFNFDKIRKPTTLGYIVGGIQSTLPNTNSMSDSAASPYIFKVILEPTRKH